MHDVDAAYASSWCSMSMMLMQHVNDVDAACKWYWRGIWMLLMPTHMSASHPPRMCCSVLQFVATCCSVLQCDAYGRLWCGGWTILSSTHISYVLQCVAVSNWCSTWTILTSTHVPACLPYGVATISRLLKMIVSFAKEPYKRDYILQKRPKILRSLLIVATPYHICCSMLHSLAECCRVSQCGAVWCSVW